MPYPALRPVRRPSRHSLVLPNFNNDVYEWDARSGVLPQGAVLTRSGAALGWVNGAYASFATNKERIEDLDYIGLPGRKGLLIEGARTNLFLNSYFDNNSAAIAPDGSSLSNNGHYLQSANGVTAQVNYTPAGASVTSGQTYTQSIYVYPTSAYWRYFSVRCDRVTGNNVSTFDLQSVSASYAATGLISSSISRIGGGWYRIAQTYVASSTGGTTFLCGLSVSSSDGSDNVINGGLGDGFGVIVWGGQTENAAFPSSPIPTSGAAATRNAELCSRSVVLPAAGWTEVLEFTTPASLSAGPELLYFNDTVKEFQVFITSAGVLNLSLTGVGTLVVASLAPSTRYKLAYLVSPGAMRCSLNGAVAIGMGGATFGPASAQHFGNKFGSSHLFAHILKCNASTTRWRAPATDAQLQQLSTLDDLDWDARMGVLPPGFALTRSGTAQGWRNGAYASFATNVERIEDLDYLSPTLAGRKGLLIEGARTNLLLRSAEFDDANWAKSLVTITPNAIAAPDGASSADLMYVSTSGSNNGVTHPIVSQTAAATKYELEVFAKAAGKSWLSLAAYDNGSNGVIKYYNISTGVVGTSAPFGTGWTIDGATITPLGNGWYKCVLLFTTGAAAVAVKCQVKVTDADNNTAATANATDGFYLWNAQLEQAAFPSSPIPTAGATATRNAETCPRAVVLPAAGFTAVVEFIASQDLNAVYWQADDGGSSNRFNIFGDGVGGLTGRASVAGSNVYSANIGSITPGQRYRVAVRYQANNFRGAINGSLGTLGSSGALPTGITTERLGHNHQPSLHTFANILRCNYSPTIWRAPVDDATLQALSTLT